MGDPETKRKRYCLMCNVFKPDRCHHCSACNRCVLNMDHHCPWVNNCIGFWNRKFFILLLFYGVSILITFAIGMFMFIIHTVQWHMTAYTNFTAENIDFKTSIIYFIIDITYLFVLFLLVILTKFTMFHITLINKNMTTLESLEHKGTDYESLVFFVKYNLSKFDIGKQGNWSQVFGRNPFLWVIPIMGRSGKPDGSGVNWPTKHNLGSIDDKPSSQDDMVFSNSQNYKRPKEIKY